MKTIVLSVGGSLICPGKVDIPFLKKLKKEITLLTKKYKVAIYCGGGGLARIYQKASRNLTKVSQEEQDWVGTIATRLNAQLLHSLFSKIAHKKVVYDPTKKINLKSKVLIAAGWKPGWSTDYDAVLLAKNLGAKTVVNLTNVDYVYDKNPSKFKNAKPLKNLSWTEFQKIVGTKWTPGLNAPFDPIAAKASKKYSMNVILINGKNLPELRKYLSGKSFKGTLIS